MGLARVCKPEGLVSCEAQSKNAIENVIQKSDSNRRDSEVQSTVATQKCDQLNRESKSLQVCKAQKFASLHSKNTKDPKNSFE